MCSLAKSTLKVLMLSGGIATCERAVQMRDLIDLSLVCGYKLTMMMMMMMMMMTMMMKVMMLV
jgi:hypothetical protein